MAENRPSEGGNEFSVRDEERDKFKRRNFSKVTHQRLTSRMAH